MISMADLDDRLKAECERYPFATHWWMKTIPTGQIIEQGGAVPLPSASTRKVSIMMAALKAAHEGRLDLDERITIEAWHQEGVVSGVLRFMTPGLVIPLRDAIVQMIITSDNVATRLVVDRLGLDAINAFCRSIGMHGTIHRVVIPPLGTPPDHSLDAVTVTTPCDQGLLLDLIQRGSEDQAVAANLGSTARLCGYAIDILRWQQHRNMIPSLLPFETEVANKTGRGARGRMDVGLVFRRGRPLFILAAFTDHVPAELPDGLPGHAASFQLIGRLARLCWDRIDPE